MVRPAASDLPGRGLERMKPVIPADDDPESLASLADADADSGRTTAWLP
jgi:hypothetical protein